ncbi:hypothetical protein JYK02_18270 [Corallococcus macrosporus]|uniref:Uncharacterized protein n=1 Tax=Corallococcus macrosporus TaxID=35 RepID=A0ABS3DCP7_9BACT|nr:hypothetical protein [Corallococcus macrosporus]MBN8229460.1 hypothetical protein [Corallococcus macrosporus]
MRTTHMPRLLALSLVVPLSACLTTASPTQLPLPKERAQECGQLCEQIGMKLSAVVIIMNSSGCVCEPKPEAGTNAAVSGTAAASGAVIQAAANAAQRSNNASRSSPSRR